MRRNKRKRRARHRSRQLHQVATPQMEEVQAQDISSPGRPARGGHVLLQLQRQYGNHYVQRVLAQTRRGEGQAGVAPDVERAIQRARGRGQALDREVRAQTEPALGADFGGVRVHTDAQADRLNRALNARAFTSGRDIFFRQGAYSPGSSTGRELMAHELTHVAQQAGRARPKLTVGQPGDRYEQEADRAARAVLQQEQQPIQKDTDEGLVQRQVEEEEEPIQTKAENGWVQRQVGEEEEEKGSVQARAKVSPAQSAAPQMPERELVRQWVAEGKTNENILTNNLYYRRHPEADRSARIKPGTPEAREWIQIRNSVVRPVLRTPAETTERPASTLEALVLRPLWQELKRLTSILDSGSQDLHGLLTSKEKPAVKTKVENEVRDTLKEAIALEGELRSRHPDYAQKGGFVGYGAGKDQYVCTTFAQEVLRRAGYQVSGKVGQKININIDWKAVTGAKKPSKQKKQEALRKLVAKDDPRIQGVVNALVSSGQGVRVAPEQLRPGDFVQYWYESKKGIGGHVVQVVKVLSPGKKIRAHGSHAFTRGITTITVYLKGKKMKRVYGVRPI